MPEQPTEIVCALCSCHFDAAELKDDEILCEMCGHSVDDDHAIAPAMPDWEEAQSYLK